MALTPYKAFSLVPYLGKRGENRKPLYVECTASGLIFHPDRQTLAAADLTMERLRGAILARMKRAEPGGSDRVYWLLLVRPGFVTGRMTEGMSPAPLASTPVQVAERVVRALYRGRSRIWVPPALRPARDFAGGRSEGDGRTRTPRSPSAYRG